MDADTADKILADMTGVSVWARGYSYATGYAGLSHSLACKFANDWERHLPVCDGRHATPRLFHEMIWTP